ncbi:MAG: hypothetical protein D4R65_10805 [Verrucomicrobiaceae bacterium]|nr:MAG: hypothetical protein D4R65_10805 [Verrucomicrobiaceae bacterium]
MLLLLIFSGIWMISLSGWGGLFLQSLPGVSHRGGLEDFGIRVVLGHIPVLAIGFVVHLVSPLLIWYISLLPLGGLLLAGRQIKSFFLRACVPAFALAIFTAFFASRPIAHGDSGYYGIPVISWIAGDSVVRGLANLDPTYGYNSSWWVLASVMSWPVGARLGVICVSVPFLCGVGMILLSAIHRVLTGKGSRADWYLIPAFYLWFRQIVGVNTPSPSTDIPANLCMLLAFHAMVRGLDSMRPVPSTLPGRTGNPGYPGVSEEVLFFASFSVLAASAKLSAGLLLLAAFVWMAILIFKDRHARSILWTRKGLFFWLGALLTVQLFHGFLLSGYPLFPSGLGGWWDISWRVDPSLPAATVQRAHDWAQTFGATTAETARVPGWRLWIERQGSATNLLMAGTAALAGVLGSGILLLRRKKEALAGRFLLIPAAVAVGLLAWNLIHAPALRFGAGYAFAILGCLAGFAGPLLSVTTGRVGVIFWIAASALSMSKLATERRPSWIDIPPLPVSTFEERKTDQGETIFIPAGGLAWIGPRPSTPSFEFNPRLWIIRSPGSGKTLEIQYRKK